jgi:hypothetical protein
MWAQRKLELAALTDEQLELRIAELRGGYSVRADIGSGDNEARVMDWVACIIERELRREESL